MTTLADEMRQLDYDRIKESYKYKDILQQIKDAVEDNDRSIEVSVSNDMLNTLSLKEVLIADGLTVTTNGDRVGTTFYISW